jgi:hypothetical protein
MLHSTADPLQKKEAQLRIDMVGLELQASSSMLNSCYKQCVHACATLMLPTTPAGLPLPTPPLQLAATALASWFVRA